MPTKIEPLTADVRPNPTVEASGATPDENWGPGKKGRRLCRIPLVHDVNGEKIQVTINGTTWKGGMELDLTQDEWNNVLGLMGARVNEAFKSRFGDPDLPKKGVNIRVATIPGH